MDASICETKFRNPSEKAVKRNLPCRITDGPHHRFAPRSHIPLLRSVIYPLYCPFHRPASHAR
ncbi:hypothetical protein J6590_012300 [Homalodisca vitripennis]|nr:hypothetical protein J6590_012300 [Homalodisca vitripennis]